MSVMNFLKKTWTIIMPYAMSVLTANLIVAILIIIFKLTLVTVQGPTTVTRISEIATYYISLSTAAFIFFYLSKNRNQQKTLKEILYFYAYIMVTHVMIIFFASWEWVWFATLGSFRLTYAMVVDGGYIESIREIPRLFYLLPLIIEDFCLLFFSSIGHLKGYHKQV